jgi:hypothetical protein
VVFLIEFKEFPLRNQIYVSTVLLVYIFGYLFDCGCFGDYLLFSIGIGAKVIGSSGGSVTLREGVLGCNHAALLTWTAFKTCLVGCDFECHKSL